MKSTVKSWFVIFALGVLVLNSGQVFAGVSRDTVLSRSDVMDIVVVQAMHHELDPELALAVAKVESNFKTHVVSHAGARGVMQIMPRTGRTVYGLAAYQLFDPQINVRTGVHYLKSLINQYGRVDIALSHYNGGSKVRSPDGRLRVIPATRGYVNKVLRYKREYRYHPKVVAARSGTAPHFQLAFRESKPLDDFSDPASPLFREDYSGSNAAIATLPQEEFYAAGAVVDVDERGMLVSQLRELRQSINRRFSLGYESEPGYFISEKERRIAKVRRWERYE